MAARNTPKTVRSAAAKPVELKPTVVDESITQKPDAWSRLQLALDEVQKEYGIVSWKRYLCSMVLSFSTAFGAGYLIGALFEPLIIMAFMSGSAFLAFISVVLTMIIGGIVGGYLGTKAFQYVVSGRIDLHYAVAKGAVTGAARWVGGLFSSKNEVRHA